MTFAARAFATLLMLAPLVAPAQAQSPEPPEPATLVREALASAYGKALIAELGKKLRTDADPACPSSKGLAANQLEARGLELMTNWGTRMMEKADSSSTRKSLRRNLPAAPR